MVKLISCALLVPDHTYTALTETTYGCTVFYRHGKFEHGKYRCNADETSTNGNYFHLIAGVGSLSGTERLTLTDN